MLLLLYAIDLPSRICDQPYLHINSSPNVMSDQPGPVRLHLCTGCCQRWNPIHYSTCDACRASARRRRASARAGRGATIPRDSPLQLNPDRHQPRRPSSPSVAPLVNISPSLPFWVLHLLIASRRPRIHRSHLLDYRSAHAANSPGMRLGLAIGPVPAAMRR